MVFSKGHNDGVVLWNVGQWPIALSRTDWDRLPFILSPAGGRRASPPSAPWSAEKGLPGSGGLFRHSCCCPRRVRSPNGQPGCRGRWFRSEPPREVTSPIRPQNLSVGLFTAAVLCASAPIWTGCADLPSGPALRADPCVKETKRHGALTYRQYIRTIARRQAVSPAVSLPAA